jgi:two-component system LytT family response regulator
MIRSLIIEDDSNARKALRKMIEQSGRAVEIVGEASTVDQALKMIRELDPELLFLDIRLKQGSGFDVLSQVDTSHLSVIFTTAYSEFAIQAIKSAALDYLLKPIDPEELGLAIEKYTRTLDGQLSARLKVLEEHLSPDGKQVKMVLTDAAGFHVIALSDILHCEGEKNYTTFHLQSGKKIVTSKSLIEYERLLDANDFMRVHKSHLIALDHVTGFIRGRGGEAVLSDGSQVPISREKKEAFLTVLAKRIAR